MKSEDLIYEVIETWDCYSDYTESVIYVSDKREDAIQMARKWQLIANSQCLAKVLSGHYSDDVIDEDSTIRLRIYPFKKPVSSTAEAEREALGLDDDHDIKLATATEVNGVFNGKQFHCFQLDGVVDDD